MNHRPANVDDAWIIEALILDEENDPKEELLVIDLTEKLPDK